MSEFHTTEAGSGMYAVDYEQEKPNGELKAATAIVKQAVQQKAPNAPKTVEDFFREELRERLDIYHAALADADVEKVVTFYKPHFEMFVKHLPEEIKQLRVVKRYEPNEKIKGELKMAHDVARIALAQSGIVGEYGGALLAHAKGKPLEFLVESAVATTEARYRTQELQKPATGQHR